jgi:tripeptide aminopeptidase
MIHAARIGMELTQMLPSGARPEFTQGYEGFFHLLNFEGTAEEAFMHFLIRDHDRELFEEKKRVMSSAVDYLKTKYPDARIELDCRDSYYNMKEKILPLHAGLIEKTEECMKELGIEPLVRPIRGGTDGANLSMQGLPCPNLCAGGHNFHGIYEYIPMESLEQITKLLILMADRLTEQN